MQALAGGLAFLFRNLLGEQGHRLQGSSGTLRQAILGNVMMCLLRSGVWPENIMDLRCRTLRCLALVTATSVMLLPRQMFDIGHRLQGSSGTLRQAILGNVMMCLLRSGVWPENIMDLRCRTLRCLALVTATSVTLLPWQMVDIIGFSLRCVRASEKPML